MTAGMAFLQAGLFAGVGGDGERAAVLFGTGDRHFVMEKAPFYIRQLRPGRIQAATDALGEERYKQNPTKQESLMSVEEATEFLLSGT